MLIVDVIYAALALLALGKASALFKTRAALSGEAMQQLFQESPEGFSKRTLRECSSYRLRRCEKLNVLQRD